MPAHVDKSNCLGCGACTAVCPTGAVALGDDGLAEVNEDLCIDCGACTGACPVGTIELS